MNKGELINLGLENIVLQNRVVAIVKPDTAPIRRLIHTYEDTEDKDVVDITRGRKTRSVVLTDADMIILSPVRTKTVSERIMGQDA